MKLRQFTIRSSLVMAAVALTCTQVFAADPANTTQNPTPIASKDVGTTKKSVRAANRAFSKTIQKALFKTQGLENVSISVFGNAKSGHVTLAGQIESDEQDGLAVDAVKKMQGVTSVTSKLTLRQQGGG